jgi:hypothetical protein
VGQIFLIVSILFEAAKKLLAQLRPNNVECLISLPLLLTAKQQMLTNIF